MIRFLSICFFLLSGLLAAPLAAQDTNRRISGQITLLERMAVPDHSVVIVDISDDTDTTLVAQRRLAGGTQSPFAFELDAPADRPLILRAGLRAADDMVWLTEPVAIAAGTDPVDLGPIRALRTAPMGFASLLACGTQLLEIGFLPDDLRLRFNEQVIIMTPAEAASGALYAAPDNAATSIHIKVDTALLRIDGAELSECRLIRPEQDITQGVWRITAISDKPTVFPSRTELVFYADGRMSASVGCNRLIGGYRRHGGILSFGRIASTMMACPDGMMQQEHQFTAMLRRVDGYQLVPETGRLTLMAGGQPVISARR
ncbi:META domain-containing protein [Roseinatronobacter alkalisoli]|uniref:META domain-containing protein n=1 Tax=Roseinatronobacter alkalisoli TaxID=3028235 RepID=A0ABT5TG75_9RHOB|nr:META domain-containing protein [Roseinatronobacter sp. HJB301]MDD7973172.1 META domain-containing protein [Roseinatronobacter sp. HJB301]